MSDEQAKAIQEAIKALRGVGGFLREILGTVPEDLVGYFGGDWLKVRRAENAARIIEKARARLEARKETPERPSLSILMPLLITAANEERGELQDLWARLLAAAADPTRTKFFRQAFIDIAKRMDPADAEVLRLSDQMNTLIRGNDRNEIATQLKLSRDQVDVSIANLVKLEMMVGATLAQQPDVGLTPLGREFLRAVAD